MGTLRKTLEHNHTWAINRINLMADDIDTIQDAHSICQEFEEWLDPDGINQEVFSLEYFGEGSEYQ